MKTMAARSVRAFQLAAAVALLTPLASCKLLECFVLCETFYFEAMTNPKTGEHFTCGGFIQKSPPSREQRKQIDACVASHAMQGFVLDKSRR